MNKKTKDTRKLAHKVAIVTGGASGIGAGICLEFASCGAVISIADIDLKKAELVARRIKETGGRAIAVEVDVRDRKQIEGVVKKTKEHFGTIDILVNCAGVDRFKFAHEFSVEEWEWIRSVNLDGAWHFCQAVLHEMIKKRRGRIINISSASGIRARPKGAPYVITKHGLVGLTKALAVDMGSYGINANCICPASIDTPLLRKGTSKAYRDAMKNRLPLGRLGKVSDIAKACVFLASSDSDWITGAILPVDGGLNCCSVARHVD